MKTRVLKKTTRALTLIEVLVTVLIVGLLSLLLLSFFSRGRARAGSICCNCNLKQIGLSFRQYAVDHAGKYPMQVSVTNGGAMEVAGNVYIHFRSLSNELSTPKLLACPNDTRQPSKDFGKGFNNGNVSYFVGLDADEGSPGMFLSGDRNIVGGTRSRNGILELTTNNTSFGWGKDIHNDFGNIAFADGSVQQATTPKLREMLARTGVVTNRLAMP